MKLNAQIQLFTLIIFWVLKASLALPDHNQLNWYDQFITLIDMKLHAQNQLYTCFSFWDRKVLIACFGMRLHVRPRAYKITSSICSFNRYEAACKKSALNLQ